MNDLADVMRACLAESFVRVRTGLPVGNLRLRPAAAADLAVAIQRDRSDTLRQIFGEGVDLQDARFLATLRDDEEVRTAFLLLALACVRRWSDRLRILLAFVRPAAFTDIALTCLILSFPQDVASLLPKPKKSSEDEGGEGLDPEELPAWILRTVVKLRHLGHHDADQMSMTRLTFAAGVDDRTKLEGLKLAAYAGRAAQADKKGWKDFEESI